MGNLCCIYFYNFVLLQVDTRNRLDLVLNSGVFVWFSSGFLVALLLLLLFGNCLVLVLFFLIPLAEKSLRRKVI